MPAPEAIALFAAAAAAGAVNAVAGGGTLITFPSLILAGTPAIIANVIYVRTARFLYAFGDGDR